MKTIPKIPLHVQSRRLRVFGSVKAAEAWEEDRHGHGTICLVAGAEPTLRWWFQPGRCYDGSRTPILPPDDLRRALRRLLVSYGNGDFYNGICQGYVRGYAPRDLPLLVTAICDMTGARA